VEHEIAMINGWTGRAGRDVEDMKFFMRRRFCLSGRTPISLDHGISLSVSATGRRAGRNFPTSFSNFSFRAQEAYFRRHQGYFQTHTGYFCSAFRKDEEVEEGCVFVCVWM
jgi:hypothetical protein